MHRSAARFRSKSFFPTSISSQSADVVPNCCSDCFLSASRKSVCIAMRPICSFARTSPAANVSSSSRWRGFAFSKPKVLRGSSFPSGQFRSSSFPPRPVRRALARVLSEPYTFEASTNAVIVLICSRIPVGEVPADSAIDRVRSTSLKEKSGSLPDTSILKDSFPDKPVPPPAETLPFSSFSPVS